MFVLANSHGSRIVAIAHEEADAAGMPRLAFDSWWRGSYCWDCGRMIVEMAWREQGWIVVGWASYAV